MSAFNAKRDAKVADEVNDRTGMCAADGCPNRWSTTITGALLCGPHSRASTHQWPAITQEQRNAETEHAIRAAHPAPATLPKLAQRIRTLFASPDDAGAIRAKGRSQAQELRARELRGEHLSVVQREWWRHLLGAHGVLDAAKQGGNVPENAITDALQQTGDLPWPDRYEVPTFDEPIGEAS